MTESEFSPGSAIGGLTVLAFCGSGAYGQVYLVRDGGDRRLALKVLSRDRRGERELEGSLRFRRVRHPNLLHIDRLGTLTDGRAYYTMDAADDASGGDGAYAPDTLERRMRSGPLPSDELRRIMLGLVSGLAELHRAHLIHRDIKPENILFIRGRAVLADAGTVADAEGASLVGTLEYLPPEVRMGKRSPVASDDCYALGKVLYSALTNEAPDKFPSTPHTLENEAVALFRVAERACTPPGVSAYRFRELLEHPERARLRRRSYWLPVVCVLLAAALAAVLTFWALRLDRPAAPEAPPPAAPVRVVPAAPAAETPAVPVPATSTPTAPVRRDPRIGGPGEGRDAPSSINIHIAGVKMDLESAERTRQTFLDKGLDITEQRERVAELRAELELLEGIKKMPPVDRRRAFNEYLKRRRRTPAKRR